MAQYIKGICLKAVAEITHLHGKVNCFKINNYIYIKYLVITYILLLTHSAHISCLFSNRTKSKLVTP